MAVSSANILVLVLWMSEKGKSLQYTMYSSGESTEPWGTPAFRWTVFERVLFTLILQDLLVRKEEMSLVNLRFRRRFRSFCTSPSCQTLSNALSMSRKTPTVHSPRLACLVISV
jgi:hypothetical protein